MKKTLCSLLSVAALCFAFAACNSGNYNANPGSNANGSINPLNPLTSSQFTWGGTDPMSADINGQHWVADTGAFYFSDTVGYNTIIGSKGHDSSATELALYLKDVWGGNLYSLGYKKFDRYGVWIDMGGNPYGVSYANWVPDHYYFSYLGNSGEVKIIQNDTAVIKGLFYFQGVNAKGQPVTVSNGYFNLHKPHP